MKNDRTYDVIITGGGIMGSATAYYVTRLAPGLKVAVVERDPSYARASTTLSMSNVRIQFSLKENAISRRSPPTFSRILRCDGALYGSALARVSAVDYIYEEAFGRVLPATLHLGVEDWAAPAIAAFPPEKRDSLMVSINLVRITVGTRSRYDSLISSGHLSLIENKDLARKIQNYYKLYDDLVDTGNGVFRAFRNGGAAIYQGYGVSVFDERPPAEIVALARDNPDFAAYLRSMREWAIVHAGLLDELRGEKEGHLKKDTVPGQIAFELLGIVLASHNHGRLLGDKEARRRALTAFDALIARHAASAQPRLRAATR